jgi:predicted dehydrogenase
MIKIAIIGTGGMANYHVKAFQAIRGVKVTAVCDVQEEAAKNFAKSYKIKNYYTSVSDLLESENLDAISNVTPDRFHKEISIQALQKGLHVLCEKPLAENYQDAAEMVEVAEKSGKINMVNFSYRNAPVIHHAAKQIQAGKIGEIIHVDAAYLQSWCNDHSWGGWKNNPGWLWRLSSEHGSKGVLGDVGVHIVDFASLPIGSISKVNAKLKTFPKGIDNQWKEYTLDANDSAILQVEFENGALGTIHTTRWASGHANTVKISIFGTLGGIQIDLSKSYTEYQICKGKQNLIDHKWETITCKKTPNNHERFIKSIKTGIQDQPDFARGAEIQKILDSCFESDKKDKTILL